MKSCQWLRNPSGSTPEIVASLENSSEKSKVQPYEWPSGLQRRFVFLRCRSNIPYSLLAIVASWYIGPDPYDTSVNVYPVDFPTMQKQSSKHTMACQDVNEPLSFVRRSRGCDVLFRCSLWFASRYSAWRQQMTPDVNSLTTSYQCTYYLRSYLYPGRNNNDLRVI